MKDFACRYAKSNAMLERSLKTIPMAAQTFSKSCHQFPHPVAPLFLIRGKGVPAVEAGEVAPYLGGRAPLAPIFRVR